MTKKTDCESYEKRLVGIEEFMQYTGLGRNMATSLGKEIGCCIRIGKKVLYDIRKADQYFNSLTGVK